MTINAKWFALIGAILIAVAPSIVTAQIIWDAPNSGPEFSFEPTVSIGYLSPNNGNDFFAE